MGGDPGPDQRWAPTDACSLGQVPRRRPGLAASASAEANGVTGPGPARRVAASTRQLAGGRLSPETSRPRFEAAELPGARAADRGEPGVHVADRSAVLEARVQVGAEERPLVVGLHPLRRAQEEGPEVALQWPERGDLHPAGPPAHVSMKATRRPIPGPSAAGASVTRRLRA